MAFKVEKTITMSSEGISKSSQATPIESNPARRIVLQSANDTVILKQLVPEDAELYFQLVDSDRAHLSQHGDETASKYPDVEAVREGILRPSNPEKYRFGIWDGDTMVGSDNLTPKEPGRAELGSWVAKKYTGNRYAGRARKLLIDFAFNQLHLDEVFCEITIGNDASRKSVERSDFTLSGEKEGKWVYTLKRPESTDYSQHEAFHLRRKLRNHPSRLRSRKR